MVNRAASLISFTGCSQFKALVNRSYCIQSKEVKKFRSFAASAAHIQLTLCVMGGGGGMNNSPSCYGASTHTRYVTGCGQPQKN
jgi:hypothetical protein